MGYETLNDMVRDLKLDYTNWINKESKKFLKESTYQKTNVKIKHIPKALIKEKFQCKNGHTFKVPWLEKRYPTSIFYTKEGLLRQSTCYIICPICKEQNSYNLKIIKYKGDINIYGDEAFRDVDDKKVFVYTYIFFSGKLQKKQNFEKKFLELKKNLAPGIKPNDWVLHMTDIVSSSKRNKREYLAHLSQKDILYFIKEFLKYILLYTKKNDLEIFSAIGISDKTPKIHQEEVLYKEEIYSSMIMHIVSDVISRGYAPKFYFERTKKDGWAKNIFDGGRLTLLWSRITYGIPVMTPKFVEPSFSMYLELADLVSYILGRHIYSIGSQVEGKTVVLDFSPSEIGKINYLLTDANGDTNLTVTNSFPNKKMFNGSSWSTNTAKSGCI